MADRNRDGIEDFGAGSTVTKPRRMRTPLDKPGNRPPPRLVDDFGMPIIYRPDPGSLLREPQPGDISYVEPTDPVSDAEQAEIDRRQRDIYATITQTLAEYEVMGPDIEALIQQLIIEDATEAEWLLRIRETQTWKDRFAGNEMRRAAGLSPLSPNEYIAYERSAHQLMSEARLPAGFYDSRADYTELIGRDISLRELSRRIDNGYRAVANAAPEIRRAFADYFGADGDSALAALFLNYDKGVDVLEKHVAAAQFGGIGRRFGFNPDQNIALRAADIGITQEMANAGFGQLVELAPLFTETISESEDLTAEKQGFDSVFGFNPQAVDEIRQRREARVARGKGSQAGTSITNQGALGLRIASQDE